MLSRLINKSKYEVSYIHKKLCEIVQISKLFCFRILSEKDVRTVPTKQHHDNIQ